jgi:hypothetical protein
VKCDQYWPECGVGNYGDIDVTTVREDVLAFYTLRTFSVELVISPTVKKKKGETKKVRTVYQYHYTAWPDHGVPLHALPLISFVRNSAAANPDSGTPIVVHCRSGSSYSYRWTEYLMVLIFSVLVLVALGVILLFTPCCSRLSQEGMWMCFPSFSTSEHRGMAWFRQRSSQFTISVISQDDFLPRTVRLKLEVGHMSWIS